MTSAAGGTDAAPRGAPRSTPAPGSAAPGSVEIHEGDNLEVIRRLPDASFTLIYLDPPFNTGRPQERSIETARSRHPSPSPSPDVPVDSLSARPQRADETVGDSHGLGDPVGSRRE
ncbi:hypothetical protein ACI3KX_15540, partial [Microbacterium sp. ZW CA_36]